MTNPNNNLPPGCTLQDIEGSESDDEIEARLDAEADESYERYKDDQLFKS